MTLVDTHAHLDDRRLKSDLPRFLRQAREAGVAQIVAISTTAEDSASVLQAARENPGVFAAVGIHPNDCGEAKPGDWETIVRLLDDPRVRALGETGLDLYWKRVPLDTQRDYFERHLAVAADRGLPVVIHCRDCEGEILSVLKDQGREVKGVLHSFTGTWQHARAFLDAGLHVSFAGMLTFANKTLDALRDAAAKIPAERLLVETDSPYLTPHPHRGKPNQPAYVALTAAKLAEVRGVSLEEISRITTENARRLFNLPPEDLIQAS